MALAAAPKDSGRLEEELASVLAERDEMRARLAELTAQVIETRIWRRLRTGKRCSGSSGGWCIFVFFACVGVGTGGRFGL